MRAHGIYGFICLTAFVLSLTAPTQAALYQITDLGTLGGPSSYGQAINNTGTVVGIANQADFRTQAFYYNTNNMQTLKLTTAQDINTQGQVVGHQKVDGVSQAAVFSNGTIITVGPTTGSSTGTGINNAGNGVGNYTSGSADQAFFFDSMSWQTLDALAGSLSAAWDINDNGQIAGYSSTAEGNIHAVRYDDLTPVDLGTLGGRNSYGQGINSLGQVVGYAQIADGNIHACLHNGTDMIDLGTLGGLESYAYSLNDQGQAVGRAQTLDGYTRAFLYENGMMYDLMTLLADAGDWQYLSAAYDINEAGSIVGYGVINNQRHAFMLQDITVVPLPAALWMFVSGLLGMGIRRRSKKQ